MIFNKIELMKFLMNNIIKLLISTIVFTLLFYFATIPQSIDIADTNQTIDDDEVSGNTSRETESFSARFSFVVEYEDGKPYSNGLLIEQYILSANVLDIVSEELDLNLKQLINETENEITIDLGDQELTTKVLGIYMNENSNLIELTANVGNQDENLSIINFLYNFILDGGVPFLENKEIYVFRDPELKELNIEFNETDDENVQEKIVDTRNSNLTNIVIGSGLGFSLALIILFISSFFSKKLKYLFSYYIEDRDVFFLIDKNSKDKSEFLNFLQQENEGKKYLMREETNDVKNQCFDNIVNDIKNNTVECKNSVLGVTDLTNSDALIYIIEEGQTSRKWYEKQRKFDSYLNVPTYIVQINKNKF